MKRILTLLVLLSFAVALSGCNTVRGMGKDIEKAGETIREVAE